jgi:hypothetical protein
LSSWRFWCGKLGSLGGGGRVFDEGRIRSPGDWLEREGVDNFGEAPYMNVISTSPSDFDGVTAGCSCRVLSRRNDSGIGPCQRFKL